MLAATQYQLACAPGRCIQFDAGVAVTLEFFLDPGEELGPGRLRADITAIDATGEHRDEEQSKGGDDQCPGQVNEILRPERKTKHMKLAAGQIKQHGLAALPLHPGKREVQ